MSLLVPYTVGIRVISEVFVYKAYENLFKLGYNDYYSQFVVLIAPKLKPLNKKTPCLWTYQSLKIKGYESINITETINTHKCIKDSELH